MKENKKTRLITIALILALIALILVASSYAKYLSSGTGSDTARVAKWSFKVGGTDIVTTDKDVVASDTDTKLAANGGNKIITVQWKWAYEGNDTTDVTLGKDGTLKENIYIPTKDLCLKIKLKDNSGNEVKIPQGTQVKVNNAEVAVENGLVLLKLLDNLDTTSVEQDMKIILDMTGVLSQDRLSKGDYKIEIEYLNSKEYEELTENNITIIDKQKQYGLSTIINQQEGISSDKIQIIKQGQEESRSIKINYSNSSELQNMKIKIKAVERTGEFEYKETTNSQNKNKKNQN